MSRSYYSRRHDTSSLTIPELYSEVCKLYLYLRERDFFEEVGITTRDIGSLVKRKASFCLGFQPFPLTNWVERKVEQTEARVFDAIEFLYDCAALPGEWDQLVNEYGYTYNGYVSYDSAAGKTEFRNLINPLLRRYSSGFELDEQGQVLSLSSDIEREILIAQVPSWEDGALSAKVEAAIQKFRNRNLDLSIRRSAIQDLADVFEWLRKSDQLGVALRKKDESMLFEIANKFAIRHHDHSQRSDYDQDIWYSWIFHFYLATVHAVLRLLSREAGDS